MPFLKNSRNMVIICWFLLIFQKHYFAIVCSDGQYCSYRRASTTSVSCRRKSTTAELPLLASNLYYRLLTTDYQLPKLWSCEVAKLWSCDLWSCDLWSCEVAKLLSCEVFTHWFWKYRLSTKIWFAWYYSGYMVKILPGSGHLR